MELPLVHESVALNAQSIVLTVIAIVSFVVEVVANAVVISRAETHAVLVEETAKLMIVDAWPMVQFQAFQVRIVAQYAGIEESADILALVRRNDRRIEDGGRLSLHTNQIVSAVRSILVD